MRISDLARNTGTSIETVRYYERAGLLRAAGRTEGNYRVYGAPDVERLKFIRNCRALDMALDEIRALLRLRDEPQENCGAVNQLLDDHIGHVTARIRELKALEKQLKALREECRETPGARACAILKELSGEHRNATPASGTTHIRTSHG